MNKLAEKGFAISKTGEKSLGAVFPDGPPEGVYELSQKPGKKEATLKVLDAEAFSKTLGAGAHAVQGGLEGHRHFKACEIILREVEERQETKPNGINGNGKVADPAAAKIPPRAKSGRTFTGEVHGYTFHCRENKCGACGKELTAEDGHYHEYMTDGGQGVPDVCCCTCKGHKGENAE